jgi:hypothetical protein
VGLSPEKILKDVDISKIDDSVQLLTELGAAIDGKVTELGRFISTIPMGVRNGSFLYNWLNSGYPVFPGVVIACLIDGYQSPGYFYTPRKGRGFDYNEIVENFNEILSKYRGDTQIHTFLNLWNDFSKSYGKDIYNIIKDGEVRGVNMSRFKKWGNDNMVNQKKFVSLINHINRTYYLVRNSKYISVEIMGPKRIGIFDPTSMANIATSLLVKSYTSNLLTNMYGYMYSNCSLKTHVLNTQSVLSNMESGDYQKNIYAISTIQIKDKIVVSMSIPTQTLQSSYKQEEEAYDEIRELSLI